MKSIDQKRKEAYDRLVRADYNNSKAKRKGVPIDQWEEERNKHLDHLDKKGV